MEEIGAMPIDEFLPKHERLSLAKELNTLLRHQRSRRGGPGRHSTSRRGLRRAMMGERQR